MEKVVYNASLAINITTRQREIIERLADECEISLAEAARTIIDRGIASMNLD